MKKITLKLAIVGIAATLAVSCSKKIDDAYANPNADVRVPPEKLLPYIVNSMFANANGHGPANDARFIGAYIQNWFYAGVSSNYDRMGYTNSAADVSQSIWRMHYYDIGQNCNNMIAWADEEQKWGYAGAGKAVFAWSWLLLTEIYGEVILKEAFNTRLYTFKYDTQPEVYAYVKQLCFEALDYLNRPGAQGTLAEGDAFFYGGDVNKWKKFVYAILARYYHHQSNKANYKADSVIYYCNLSLSSNADNATVKYAATGISGTNNFFGPLRNNFVLGTNLSPTAFRQSAFIANLMTGANTTFSGVMDPRTIYLLRLNTAGTFKGLNLAKGSNDLPANDRPENFGGVSQATGVSVAVGSDATARYIFRNGSPTPVLTASEVQFMKAEAAYRFGQKQVAYDAYKEGIKLHFDLLISDYAANVPGPSLLTTAIRDAYLNNPAVVPAPANYATLTLQQIMLQKYIALWGHGVTETWADMRRFHYIDPDPTGANPGVQVYTNFQPPLNNGTELFTPDNGGKYVYRIRPRFNSEYIWNVVELQRIGADQLDYHTRRMWFTEP